MSTTQNVFDPTANYTPPEKKLNQPVPQNATTASETRPQNALGTSAGVQSGPSLTQQAREGAQIAYDAVTSGLSSIMPAAASNRVPGTTSGKTTEPHFRNNMPHVGGVGDLPGSANESSVALLPDERAERDQFRTNQQHDRSTDLGAAQDASKAGAGAPLAGGMAQQHQSAADTFGRQSDMVEGFAGGAAAGAGAQTRDQGTASIGASYGIGRDVQPGFGATNQGSSAASDYGSRGVTTTSNTMPHHEQATSPSSAIPEHPTQPHHEDDTQKRGGAAVKNAAAGVTGTHRDTGTHHHDDSMARTEHFYTSNINTSATATTEHDDHHTSSTSPGSPSKMDKIKGAFMMKKGKIFHDEEEQRQGENLKTTGMRIPEVKK